MLNPRTNGFIYLLGFSIALILSWQVMTLANVQEGREFDKRLELMSGGMDLVVTTESTEGSGFTGTGSPPRVSRNAMVNDPQLPLPEGLLGRSETAIVASQGAQRLVTGWNDADGFCPLLPPGTCPTTQLGLSGFGFSTDGGKTWTDGGAPFIDGIYTFGDPWLDRGGFDKETYYYSNIAVDLASGDFGMSIHRGRFMGKSFAWEDVRFVTPEFQEDFLDKEAIAADKNGSGIVIMSLTNFLDLSHPSRGICPSDSPSGFGEIQVFRSVDGGDSWQGPVIVGPDLTDTTADPGCNVGTSQQSSSPAFGPNGEIYVVWERGPDFDFASTPPTISPTAEIVVARSLDDGASFGTPVTVANINHMRGAPPVAYNRNRTNNHPRIAVAANGKFRGRVYVTFSSTDSPVSGLPVQVACPPGPSMPDCFAQNLTSTQVFLSYSDDQGQTWSPAVPLAPPVPSTGVKRFWPTVSVEPGGSIDVTYYESIEEGLTSDPSDIECNIATSSFRRAGTAVSLVDTYWVRSGNGGKTFNAPVRVSDVSTNWCQVASNIIPNMGDYIFSVSKGNHVLATWADGRNGVPDTFYSTGLGAGKSGK